MKFPFADKLVNLVAQLGTQRDKASSNAYSYTPLTDIEMDAAYRSAWLPRKIIDIPPQDATRKWRAWQGSADQIEAIEAEEKRLGLQAKVREALTLARLRGGCGIIIGDGNPQTDQPLDPSRIAKGGLKYLLVVSRMRMNATEIERDIMSPNFGHPKSWRIADSVFPIHPSRVAIFIGNKAPGDELTAQSWLGWGDSVLQSTYQAITNADSALSNVASLLFEAKVDIFQIPGFMDQVGDPVYRQKITERMTLAAMSKGINGMLLMDKEEGYEQKQASFATLPDIIDRFLQAVSGAADIPITRLLGQSPGGLSKSTENDLHNYYDNVQSLQTLGIAPALSILDECLIRSALGNRPPEVHYQWLPLWQATPIDKAAIGKQVADTLVAINNTKLFPAEALSEAALAMLTEHAVMPGLEGAMSRYNASSLNDVPEGAPDNNDPITKTPAVKTGLKDAAPRPLYVSRQVLNAADIRSWYAAQGVESLTPAADMHVTVTYSNQPVDWLKMGASWQAKMTVDEGGPRVMEKFGDALVLSFACGDLAWRHDQMVEAGASWDHDGYQPHVTISYAAASVDPATVKPWQGPIELGPEIFTDVIDDWSK